MEYDIYKNKLNKSFTQIDTMNLAYKDG